MSENRENENNLDEIRTEASEAMESRADAELSGKQKPKGNYKTVQQLAHEYGMSKNGIMARLSKLQKEIEENDLDESDYISRGLKNTIYVLEPGLIWFAKYSADNTPMQAVSVSPDVQKLEQSEELNKHLQSEIEILKRQLEFMQENLKEKDKQIAAKDEQITAKDNQITGLTATTAQQSKTIDIQLNQILALTTSKESTPEPPQNAPQASETGVSISDEQLTTELSKRGFMGKLKLFFS